jgi:carboxylesterase
MGITGKGDPSPFLLKGGETGVLLFHGLTGSPAEMRPIGEFLNARGLTVMAPLLPGHGTRVEDLNQVKWRDWTAAAEAALAELEGRCRKVFVAGLSMGGLVTLYLASRHPELSGIVTYAAALDITDWRRHFAPIIKRVMKTISKQEEHWADPRREDLLWSYDVWPVGGAMQTFDLRNEVEASLPRIHCPALISYSMADPTVGPKAAQMILDGIASADKKALALDECGHVMTVDKGWDTLAQNTYEFIMAQAKEPTAGGGA